jgi:DNA-binding transcriptional LysR family regulator
MIERVTLGQLRAFVAAVDEGSFSAAGRKLGKRQSVITQTIFNLERQLGLKLFDRTPRKPVIVGHAESLLVDARRVVKGVHRLEARARSLVSGLESELSVVVDVMFPEATVTRAAGAFAKALPHTALHLHVGALGVVAEMVIGRRCSVGVIGSLPVLPPDLSGEPLPGVEMVTVVAPGSPLAKLSSPVPVEMLEQETQLILTDRSALTERRTLGVLGGRIWRIADLGVMRGFLIEGLGWGDMPLPVVADDLATGRLVRINLAGAQTTIIAMHAIYRSDTMPGPAARWLITELQAALPSTTTPNAAPV